MSTRSRAKSGTGLRQGKGGRRPPVRVKRGAGVPVLPIVTGAIVVVGVIVMIFFIVKLAQPQASQTPTVAGIPCDQLEHTQVHYHAALQIVYHGVLTNLAPNAGIQTNSAGAVSCYYWLHVHQQNPNVIHIESPASQTFTVGQFFSVWNQWSTANGFGTEKLDATHVAQFTLQSGDKIVVYVDLSDGKGPQLYSSDPRNITLKSHEVVTIEITPPDVNPPPAFNWSSTTNSGL